VETRVSYIHNKETLDDIRDLDEYEDQANELELALNRMGIEPFRSELLIARFVDQLSLKEIKTTYGYINTITVYRLINDTLERLRALGEKNFICLLKGYS
jgi:hypothetical protein